MCVPECVHKRSSVEERTSFPSTKRTSRRWHLMRKGGHPLPWGIFSRSGWVRSIHMGANVFRASAYAPLRPSSFRQSASAFSTSDMTFMLKNKHW